MTDYYREQGVEVLPGEIVDGVARNGGLPSRPRAGGRSRRTSSSPGSGSSPQPSSRAARASTVDNGIVVDDHGRVGGRDDVFAAGDVARFPASRCSATSVRVEHEDHAKSHGTAVGANMAGADEPYDHLPFFYSDLFDLGYEAVGEVDSRLTTVEEWAEPNRKGVVAYVDDEGRPRGFLLWDVWGKVDDATDADQRRRAGRRGEARGALC